MGKFVCAGALLQCSFGMAPSSFMVVDPMRPKVQNKPTGNILDNKPMVNIMPFGMCKTWLILQWHLPRQRRQVCLRQCLASR